MAGKGLVGRLIFLSFFIITMISAVSLQYPNKPTNKDSNGECVTVSGKCYSAFGSDGNYHIVGNCIGGSCGPCPFNPLICCVVAGGNCTTDDNRQWGVCAPTCE
jgi:hypothetical protein